MVVVQTLIDVMQTLAIIYLWQSQVKEDAEIWASLKKLWLAVYSLKTGESYDSKNWPEPE